jgi:hypothetical protein
MKQLLFAAALLLIVAASSCNFTDYESKKQVVQDSLVHIFPTWQAAKLWIDDDNTTFNVVIGDQSFYKQTQEEKDAKAKELGKMVLRIFGKDNFLKRGVLIATMDTRNESKTPADGVKMSIQIEELKKEGY